MLKRQLRSIVLWASASLVIAAAGCARQSPTSAGDDPTLPTSHTTAQQDALRRNLPFEDRRDFDEQRRGFLAAPSYKHINDESGQRVWDIGQYDFLLEGQDFDSIHPSLQRQATLNMNYGLYEVVPDRIDQRLAIFDR